MQLAKRIMRLAQRGVALASRVGWWKVGIGALVIAGAGVYGVSKLQVVPEQSSVENMRSVRVESVAQLASGAQPLSVVGSVEAHSEADVRAEKAGQIVGVYKALGDQVSAGQIVAEIENSSERAALMQAQGAVDAAQANLEKVQKGTRSEQLGVLQAADDGAKAGAVNALLSTYATLDSAVHGTADKLFTSPDSSATQVSLTFFSSNSQLMTNIINERIVLRTLLARENARAQTLASSDDISAELTLAAGEARTVRDFLDDLTSALNNAIPTTNVPSATIAANLASVTAARASVNGALSSLDGARQALATARNNLSQGVTGAQPEDIAAAQAALTQAQGALAAARANLEKNMIRSPISGTVNSFSLKVGDYVSPTQQVLSVANNGALEVIAYVTEGDAKQIAAGQRVAFDGGATGTVTKIAPALDPQTKKIEVRIGISDPNKTLINGQSVLANIERIAPKVSDGGPITIPITAIKVEADGNTVFTVDGENVLVAHAVELGTLQGDRVVIVSGLTSDMQIVVDARGLRAGQQVALQ